MTRTVIGFLGTQLDRGTGPKRWERWRPTVSIFQHDDLFVDRLVLLADPRWETLLERVVADIQGLSPERCVPIGSPHYETLRPIAPDVRESVRFPVTRYCISAYGGSDADWEIDPATGDWAFTR